MYEKQQLDPRQLGQALAADYVATGTVQRTGERFRVSPQLVRFSDGSIWGEHYDLPRSDLLSLEDAIAEEVATALRVRISSAEREKLYRRYTDNAAAYEYYLHGRAELARFTLGRSTRRASWFARILSGKNITPNRQMTKSKLPSAKGKFCAFAG